MSDAILSSVLLDQQDRDPLEEVAIGPAWLRELADSPEQSYLRIYRPRAAVAFSGKDCLEAGITTAARAAREHSFTPVRRRVGGRAAAYHPGSVGMDHLGQAVDPSRDIRHRFELFSSLIAEALRSVGIPAQVGPVPGEFCPGEFSVNDGRGHKLVGTAQRVVRGAWLFTTTILVTDTADVRGVLDAVYPALGLTWDPDSVGSVEDLIPGISVHEVQQAVLNSLADQIGSTLAEVPTSVVQRARDARPDHELRNTGDRNTCRTPTDVNPSCSRPSTTAVPAASSPAAE